MLGFVCSFAFVLGATEGTVSNTVQPKVLAFSIDKTSINWGNLSYGEPNKRASLLTPSGLITISNVGTITGKISVKTDAQTDNASHLNKWTMSATTAGANQYKLAYMVDAAWQTPEIPLTPTYTIIKTGVVAGANTTFDFWLGMPTSGTSLEAQTFSTGFLFTE